MLPFASHIPNNELMIGFVCVKIQETLRTCRTSSVPHSPALRVRGALLVKCQREAKEGAMVPQLVQCVSSIQVEALGMTEEGQHTPEE